jgi:hypothetical protein
VKGRANSEDTSTQAPAGFGGLAERRCRRSQPGVERAMNISQERQAAQAAGKIKYMPSAPCKNGHKAERYASDGRCFACQQERDGRWTKSDRGKAYMREHGRKWRAANPELARSRSAAYSLKWFRKQHGMPEPTRPKPAACECCGSPPKPDKALALDHCHRTGAFRGWLCHSCNTALGKLGDDIAGLQRAIDYLKRAGLSGPSAGTNGGANHA